MDRSMVELLLAALVFFSGFRSSYTKIARLDGGGIENSSGDIGTILTTTQMSQIQLGPSKCDRRLQEECCNATVVGSIDYMEYTEMSARGRHTVVNMTSTGLQEYTMYFAVRGGGVMLTLSSTSPQREPKTDLYYGIGFSDSGGGRIYMWEHLPTEFTRYVHDLVTTNVISGDHYSYYYVTISGDTLEVGRRGEPPLLTHTSTELRRLKYYSFEWAGSPTGAALCDCTAE